MVEEIWRFFYFSIFEFQLSANFHQYWSDGCRDMVIVSFFKMAVARHLEFLKS